MARIHQCCSSDATNIKATRVSAFDARLMRQQLPACEVPDDGQPNLALLSGDVIVQADLKSHGTGDVLISLEACEALELAKQLIASASSHLRNHGQP